MVRLDVGTLAFSTSILTLAVSMTVPFVAGKRGRGTTRPLFAIASGAYGLGVLMIVQWSDQAAALIAGNALVTLSICAAHAAICLKSGIRPPRLLYALALALLVGAFAFSLTWPYGGINFRIVATSAIRVPFCLHAVILLARHHGAAPRPSTVVQIAIFTFVTALLAMRIADALLAAQPISRFIGAEGYQALYFLGVAAFYIGLAISFILAASENEEDDLRTLVRRRTEELRQAKERAERALDAKSRFLATTGHDLRQAAHAMRLLLAATTHELEERAEDNTDLMELTVDMGHVIDAMTDQLNALLDMARLESGTMDAQFAWCPVQALFQTLASRLSCIADENDVDLRFIECSVPVWTDRALLSRALGNLIVNAIAFGRGGRVVVGCRRRPGGLALEVWDEGIGIPPSQLDKIFEDYHQVPSSNARTKGLGLGLSIVRRIADLLGHSVSVRSVEGRGSAFAVFIPAPASTTPQVALHRSTENLTRIVT